MNKQFDALTDRAILMAVPLYSRMAASWVRQAAAMKSPTQNIKLSVPEEIRQLYELVFTISYMFGYDTIADDIEALRLLEKKKANFAVWQRIDWENIGFKEALNRFLEKKIISAKDFKEALPVIKAIAFSVQRVEEENALIVLKKSIAKSIKNGIIFKDWKAGLPELFKMAGYAVADPKLTPWHLETVFRTNQASVYGAARWDGMQADDYVEGIGYSAILDTRTRAEHGALNGFAAPKNDPIWLDIHPPNEYNCRCTTYPISAHMMKAKNMKYSTMNDKYRKGVAGVHEDFTGKNGILSLEKKFRNVLMEKFKIIKELP